MTLITFKMAFSIDPGIIAGLKVICEKKFRVKYWIVIGIINRLPKEVRTF